MNPDDSDVYDMPRELELRHFRYFLTVADTLHFTRAAAKLGMAQPPLSQAIRKLEQALGHDLFQRTTRGVRLTPAGELLSARAQALFERLREDIADVRQVGSGQEGVLTIGFSGSVMFTKMPKVIELFRRRHPRVELRLREMVTAQQTGALVSRMIDLAFMRDADPTEGIVTETLLKERFMVILPNAHRLAPKKVVAVKDLAGEDFVMFGKRHGLLAYERTIDVCRGAGFAPKIVQEAPQFATVVRLVAAGVGVSLAPACMANMVVPGAVYRRVQSAVRTQVDVGVRTGSTCAMQRNFLAIARRHLAS